MRSQTELGALSATKRYWKMQKEKNGSQTMNNNKPHFKCDAMQSSCVCMRVRLLSVCFHRNWTISLILKYEQKVSPLSKHMQHKNSKNKAAAA